MTIDEFIELIGDEPLSNVSLIAASIDAEHEFPVYSSAEGGPLCLHFESGVVILEQPMGREIVRLSAIKSIGDWFIARRPDAE